jgi:DNA-binding transcriptional MerR regulator
MTLKIGRLAEVTRTTAPTIRYYEQIGLLPCPQRQDGGQRTYDESDVTRLTFIRQCREFGFAIEQSRDLLALFVDRNRDCRNARPVVRNHLAAVRRKLRELKALERSLTELVASSESLCAGGPGPDCTILRGMAAGRTLGPRKKRAISARVSRDR